MPLLLWCRPLFVALVVVSTPALASGPVLSYLKPVGTKRCAWVRKPLPSGKPLVLPFDAPCFQSGVSWSPDGSEGVIFKSSIGVKNRSDYRSLFDELDVSYLATPVRWEQNGKLVELEGLTAKKGEPIAFQLREGLLLIVVIGYSQSAHVFDTRTMKRLLHVEGVSTAVFWPEPVKSDADGP